MLQRASIALLALAALTVNTSAACRMPEKIEFRHPSEREIFETFGVIWHPLFSRFQLHDGLDYPGPIGDDIVAAEAGVVLHAAHNGQWGNQIAIQHRSVSETLETRYSHLLRHVVKEGDCVEAGQIIGKIGTIGLSTGPHLHFEILAGGKFVDPVPLLPKR